VLFDTRYFWAVFTSKNPEFLKKLRTIFDSSKTTYASAISIYEVYKLTISEEDRTVAEIRVNSIKKEFTIIDVDPTIAEEAARISHRVKVPMADALIMATARKLRVPCATDDPHFTEVKRIWVA
jgi:predicted nucleic acid-binding protein